MKRTRFRSWLNYFEARYYWSVDGRFTSIDRVFWEIWGLNGKDKNERWDLILSTPQQLNAYSYVVNNPLLYVDPNWEFAIILVFLWWWSSTATAASVSAAAYQIKEYFSDDSWVNIESNSTAVNTESPSPGNNNGKNPKKNDKNNDIKKEINRLKKSNRNHSKTVKDHQNKIDAAKNWTYNWNKSRWDFELYKQWNIKNWQKTIDIASWHVKKNVEKINQLKNKIDK